MAETVIKPGVFSQGPSPYVTAFHMGREHASQMEMFREKARLQQMEMALRQQLSQLETQERWKQLREQLKQERELEGERTKRYEASEKTRRSEHAEEMDWRKKILGIQEKESERQHLTPEQRMIEALTKIIAPPPEMSPYTGMPTTGAIDPSILQLYELLLAGKPIKDAFQIIQKRRLQQASLQQPVEQALMQLKYGQGEPVAAPGMDIGDWIQGMTEGW